MVIIVCFLIYQSLLQDDNILDVPILVLANKTDKKEAAGPEEAVADTLGLSIYRTEKVGIKDSRGY